MNFKLHGHIITPAFEKEDERTWRYFSSVHINLIIYIITQNSLIIYHYYKDWKRLSSFLFILIAATDIGFALSELGRDTLALLCIKDSPSLKLPLSEPIIEDEEHVLLTCPLYEDLRQQLLPATQNLLENDFGSIFENSWTIRDIGNYISKMFERRHLTYADS